LDELYVATKDFELIPFYGDDAIKIIVPKGVEVKNINNYGHSTLYFMENFEIKGLDWVSVYEDFEIGNKDIKEKI